MPKHRHRGRSDGPGGMNNMGPMGNMGSMDNMGPMGAMGNMGNMGPLGNIGPLGSILGSMMGGNMGQMGGNMNPLSFLTGGGLPFPFNMNSQSSDMFNNFDINSISSLFSSMAPEGGFDLNNLGAMFNSFSGANNSNSYNSNNSSGNDRRSGKHHNHGANYSGGEDGNISMLMAIRSFVDPTRARFIDRVIEMYQAGEIDY